MKIAAAYKDFFASEKRYCVLQGGAGAGKSEAAARKIILRACVGGRHLVVRKYATTLKQSVIHTIVSVLEEEKIEFEYKTQERVIYIKASGGEIIFLGLDDSEKLKSLHHINTVWVEEASEITALDFRQIDLRIRGKTIMSKQLVLTFNPVSSAKWIKEEILTKNQNDVFYQVYTVLDNPFIDEEYKRLLLNIQDATYKDIYLHGKWGDSSIAKVFNNYTVKTYNVKNDEFDAFGLDFGFNNPTALVGVKQIDGGFYIFEILYKSRLTNSELLSYLKENLPQGALIYCDSAEPQRIEEIRRAGFNAKPANKDVKAGIAFMRESKLFIDGANLIKELEGYYYKTDKNGNVLEDVIKVNDHLIDASRYAILTHFSNHGRNITEKDLIFWRKLNEVF